MSTQTDQNENMIYKGKPEMTLLRQSGAKECESSFCLGCPPNQLEAKPNDAGGSLLYSIEKINLLSMHILSTSIPAVVEQA